MKKRNVVNAAIVTALACSAPLSLDWSPATSSSPSVVISTAGAAELAVSPRRSAYRYASYRRARSYDLWCGGPYVGGGFNGGSYYGGPWMDLDCYVVR